MSTEPSAEAVALTGPLDRLAFLVSALASPYLVLAGCIALVVLDAAPTLAEAALWAGLCIGGVVGVPALYILAGVRRGHLTDVHVQLREQRTGPFVAGLVGALLAAVMLQRVGAPEGLRLAVNAVLVCGCLFVAISRYWKISVHPGTLTACALIAGGEVDPRWLAALALLPVVIWARVRRGRHTWAQGAAACLLSGGVTSVMMALERGWS